MRSSESLGNSAEINETPRTTYQERGEKGYHQELLARNAELREQLIAAGLDPDELLAKAGVVKAEKSGVEAESGVESESGVEAGADADAKAGAKSETGKETEDSPNTVAGKILKNPAFRKAIIPIAVAAAVSVGILGVSIHSANKAKAADDLAGGGPANKANTEAEAPTTQAMTPVEAAVETAIEEAENTKYAGEMANGLKYDYTEYADRDNKISYNAYGYDYSADHGDEAKTRENINIVMTDSPEVLAAYANRLLFDDEKTSIGIKDMNDTEIDSFFEKSENGDEVQKSILSAINGGQVIGSDDTIEDKLEFVEKSGTQYTLYNYHIDSNEDGAMTPDEIHIGYDVKNRNNAKQVILKRIRYDANHNVIGTKQVLLNENCDYQISTDQAPAGVPKIDENKPVPNPQVIFGGGGTTITTTQAKINHNKKPNSKPNPKPDPAPTPTPTPTPGVEAKNAANLTRIDNNILSDIADDINTGSVVVTQNPGVSASEVTSKPSGSETYNGTEATTVQNEASQAAEQVQQNVSAENDYSQDLGGANAGNANENPVQDNDAAQAEADSHEQSYESAPSSAEEAKDTLSDLGIN